MIDLEHDDLIGLKEASKLPELRRNGKAIHFATVWRWAHSGRLESVIVGGLRLTTRAAVRRMIAADNPGVVPPTSPRQRLKEIGDAEHRLAAAGV